MTRPEFGTLQRGRDIFDLLEVLHGRTSYSLTAYSPQTRAAKPQSRQITHSRKGGTSRRQGLDVLMSAIGT